MRPGQRAHVPILSTTKTTYAGQHRERRARRAGTASARAASPARSHQPHSAPWPQAASPPARPCGAADPRKGSTGRPCRPAHSCGDGTRGAGTLGQTGAAGAGEQRRRPTASALVHGTEPAPRAHGPDVYGSRAGAAAGRGEGAIRAQNGREDGGADARAASAVPPQHLAAAAVPLRLVRGGGLLRLASRLGLRRGHRRTRGGDPDQRRSRREARAGGGRTHDVARPQLGEAVHARGARRA